MKKENSSLKTYSFENIDKCSIQCDECKGEKRVRLLQRGSWNYRCGFDKRVLCCAPPNYGTWRKSVLGDLVRSKWIKKEKSKLIDAKEFEEN